jgi:hypothetical protein
MAAVKAGADILLSSMALLMSAAARARRMLGLLGFEQFPELKAVRRSFFRWMEQHPLNYDHHPDGPHEFDYYLEGSAKNWGPIRAFPSGMSALKAEQYFVSRFDGSLDKVCKTLALRGIVCPDSE